jgi:predicted transcriptional regulator
MNMKNTALITLPKASVTRVTKKVTIKQLPNMEELAESDGVVDKLWDMYQKQLKRTHEMMVLCDVLQKENEELKHNQNVIAENTQEQKPKEEKEKKLEPIGYDKLKELTGYLKIIFSNEISRTAHANALVHILHTLYQLKGQSTPDQLFASADVTDISGFRYTSFLKKSRMLKFSPTNKKGMYVMTEAGKLFVQGRITNVEEFSKATGIGAYNKYDLTGKEDW